MSRFLIKFAKNIENERWNPKNVEIARNHHREAQENVAGTIDGGLYIHPADEMKRRGTFPSPSFLVVVALDFFLCLP